MRDDHAIHGAAAAGEVDAVRRWLDADPALLETATGRARRRCTAPWPRARTAR